MTRKAVLVFLFCVGAILAHTETVKDDSIRYEVLLTGKMLYDIKLNNSLIHSVDVTSNRLILLSTSNQYYLLGWGGIKPYHKKVAGNISSFAYTSDSLLMTISNSELCCFDSTGNLYKLFKLPNEGMAITRGKYVMYIYDRKTGLQKNAIYVIAKNGLYDKIIENEKPINSVAEWKNKVLYAVGRSLFSYDIKSKKVKTLAVLSKDKEIKSIAVDTLSNRIFFSTDSMVCTIIDTSAVIISDQFGGVLQYFNKGLIVFNPERKFVIRITGLENILATIKQPKIDVKIDLQQTISNVNNNNKPKDTLTNASIVKMVIAKLSDDSIIAVINSSYVNFNVSVNDMIALSNQNVSSPVIQAMKNAMKNRPVSNSTITSTIVKKYYIIAGSFPTEKEANDAVTDLKNKGFSEAEIVGKNQYNNYRIAYKGYATEEDATKELAIIKQSTNSLAWIFKKE